MYIYIYKNHLRPPFTFKAHYLRNHYIVDFEHFCPQKPMLEENLQQKAKMTKN